MKLMIHKFTLIEMLVVIAIVCILASLIAPALSQALNASYSVLCLNNQRQCYIGFSNYSGEYNGFYPAFVSNSSPHSYTWDYCLSAGYDVRGYAKSNQIYVDPAIRLCPQNRYYKKHSTASDAAKGIHAYGMFVPLRGFYKYGFNVFIYKMSLGIGAGNSNWSGYFTKIDKVKLSSTTLMMADSSGSGGVTSNGVIDSPASGGFWNGCVNLLHGANTSANCLFFDGHAKTMESGDIYENTAQRISTFTTHEGTEFSYPSISPWPKAY